MDTSVTNTRKNIKSAKVCEIEWASLDRAAQVRSIELNGFLVMPNVIEPDVLDELRTEVERLPTTGVDYSENQRGCVNIQWTDSPQCIQLIANRTILDFLSELFGDDLVCTSCTLAVSLPGHPGIVVHTDSQPYGSKIFGVQASSPVLVRVLYYLDDLTPERSPFKVIPRSHLSLHRDGNPYQRYLNHPDEMMVTCQAGSAAIINQKVFHGNYPNYSDQPRRMLAMAYRPAWAGPIRDVEDYPPDRIAHLPPNIQPLFRSLNTREIEFDLPNRPDDMACEAEGISPWRWGADKE